MKNFSGATDCSGMPGYSGISVATAACSCIPGYSGISVATVAYSGISVAITVAFPVKVAVAAQDMK